MDGDGITRQKSTGIPIGRSKRDRRSNQARAERMAAELERRLDTAACRDELAQHIEHYRSALESHGCDDKHISGAVGRIRRCLVDGCRFESVDEFDSRPVVDWLNRQKTRQSWSNRTLNSYVESVKAFGNWLAKSGLVDLNPFRHLSKRNQETDRRRLRRPLTPPELAGLLEAAAAGPVVQGIDGPTRAILYMIAAWTGFRAKELASVSLASLSLNSTPATVTVEAGHSKRRRRDTIPLHPAVLSELVAWLGRRATIPIGTPLFDLRTPSGRVRRTAHMIRTDLAAAGIPYRDEDGRYADFHGLRHTFITSLALARVPLVEVQRLARHSDPRLTEAVYTHLGIESQVDAIERLPSPPSLRNQKGAS